MPRWPDLSRELRLWWDKQSTYPTLKQLGNRTGIPYSSLKKYFAGEKWPSEKNRQKLFSVTQLQILQHAKFPREAIPSEAERKKSQPLQKRLISKKISAELDRRLRYTSSTLAKLAEGLTVSLLSVTSLLRFVHNIENDTSGKLWIHQAKMAQGLLDVLERVLRPFLESAQGIETLRSQLSGPDAGYLSGLLAALFDDRRLSNWKAMTTYKYGDSRREG